MAQGHTVVRLLFIIVAALVLFSLVSYYNRVKSSERFSVRSLPAPATGEMMPLSAASPSAAFPSASDRQDAASSSASMPPAAVEPAGNERYRPVGVSDGASDAKQPFPQDRVSPDELLPRDAANTKWAQVNPAGQGDVRDQNFLTAGHHLGVNTQGSSLRNASWDLRSEPANPRYKVSIWSQSTIDGSATQQRRSLE